MFTQLMIKLGGGIDPGISPNWGSLPGMQQLKNLVGGGVAVVIVLLVVALITSAAVWAFGSITGRASMGSGGKTGVLVCLIAAIVVGGSSVLIRWATGVGQAISASQTYDAVNTLLASGGLSV